MKVCIFYNYNHIDFKICLRKKDWKEIVQNGGVLGGLM